MTASEPQTVIAIYRVRADKEDEFFNVLRKHHPALKGVGLVTDDEPIVYRGAEQRTGEPIVFEIFSWRDAQAPATAHELPEVMAVWEPLGQMCEERGGKPKFEFPHVVKMDLAVGGA